MIRGNSSKFLFLALFIAALFSTGFAQQVSKIGIVNAQEILEKSAEGKKVMSQLQDKDKRNQAELARRDEEIRQLQTKLNTQRLTLTQEALMNLTADLEKKQTDRKRFAEDTYREMQDLSQRMFNKIQNELLPIIEEAGKERGFDLIFDLSRSGAVYFNPVIDLTQDVIKKYDASKSQQK